MLSYTKRKKQKKLLNNLSDKLNQYDGKVYYKHYLIKKCVDKNFNHVYYTIINIRTKSHVHAETLNLARFICDCAAKIANGGILSHKISRDIYNRAVTLSLRTDLKAKVGDNNVCS